MAAAHLEGLELPNVSKTSVFPHGILPDVKVMDIPLSRR